MNMIRWFLWLFLFVIFSSSTLTAVVMAAEPSPDQLLKVAEARWKRAYYQIKDERRQAAEFQKLAELLEEAIARRPGAGVLYVARALALCSYAEVSGNPLAALSSIKEARQLLEWALTMDMDTEHRVSAHVMLGALYYKAPRWPVGFGNPDMARRHLETALYLNPDSPEANYFYGDFLWSLGKRNQGISYLQKVLRLPARSLAEREVRKKAYLQLSDYRPQLATVKP